VNKIKKTSKNEKTINNYTDEETKKIEKCKKVFCQKYHTALLDKMIKIMLEKIKNQIKNKDENEKIKIISLFSKAIDEIKNEAKEKFFKACEKSYCNPRCKNTIFQNGKEFPSIKLELSNISYKTNKNSSNPSYTKEEKEKQKKYLKIVLDTAKEMRNKIFKGKESVLKNNFYEGIETAENLKKKGAISGCSLFNITTQELDKRIINTIETIFKKNGSNKSMLEALKKMV